MDRVKIKLPDEFNFFIEEKIRVSDLNYGNHLGNDAVLSLLHQARREFLGSMDFDEMNFGGFGLIMADSAIQYKSEGFFNEKLRIKVGFGEIGRVGFDLVYQIEKDPSGEILALAKTGMILFDYDERKVVSIEAPLLERINSIKN